MLARREFFCRTKVESAAPLKPADDAILVDTTGNTLEESVSALRAIVKERMKQHVL